MVNPRRRQNYNQSVGITQRPGKGPRISREGHVVGKYTRTGLPYIRGDNPTLIKAQYQQDRPEISLVWLHIESTDPGKKMWKQEQFSSKSMPNRLDILKLWSKERTD